MFQAELMATYAVNWLGPANIRRTRFRFLDVVWPNDRLRYTEQVEKTYEVDSKRRVDSTRIGGDDVFTGWATFVAP